MSNDWNDPSHSADVGNRPGFDYQEDFIGGGGKVAGGYFGMPGRGPDGERCGTCSHCVYTRTRNPKRYYKCDLLEPTSGSGTDIRLKSPACQHWRRT